MSLATLKIELAGRNGRDALPNCFPLDVLISLTREIALVTERAQSLDEVTELGAVLRDYLRKILEMQGPERWKYYESRQLQLMPALVLELYEYVCLELVSKMIGHDVRKGSLYDRFSECFEANPSDLVKMPLETRPAGAEQGR